MEKLCPLIFSTVPALTGEGISTREQLKSHVTCLEEECAWWSEGWRDYDAGCSLPQLVEAIRNISYEVADPNPKFK